MKTPEKRPDSSKAPTTTSNPDAFENDWFGREPRPIYLRGEDAKRFNDGIAAQAERIKAMRAKKKGAA
jgi:hypothetical protein